MKKERNFVLLLFLLVLAGSCSTPTSSSSQSQTMSSDAAKEIWLGTLTTNQPQSIFNPSEYCLEDEGKLYEGFEYRMGETNLVFEASPDESLLSATVLQLNGHAEPDLTRKIVEKGPCDPMTYAPPMQLRSDWQSPECGTQVGITTRKRLEELSWFQVETASASSLLSWEVEYQEPKNPEIKQEKTAETLLLTVQNPFAFDMPELEFTLHYEGGPGKPMPVYEGVRIPALSQGGSHLLKISVLKEDEGKRYRFSSLDLRESFVSPEGLVRFEMEIPYYKLGLDKGYPSRRK